MVYANQYVDEDTLAATTKTYTFDWKPKRFVLLNDSSTQTLQFRLNPSETYATLKAGETVTVEHVSIRNLYLNSTGNVPYRLWAHG